MVWELDQEFRIFGGQATQARRISLSVPNDLNHLSRPLFVQRATKGNPFKISRVASRFPIYVLKIGRKSEEETSDGAKEIAELCRDMGHQHHLHLHRHHEAVEDLANLFSKANHDLSVVHHRLEKEFQQIYPENANPMKLVYRIKKIQEELSSLKENCRELLAAKQDLIDKARTVLVGNRSLLQRMQASSGIPITNDSDDTAFSNFNQIIDEWTAQLRSKAGDAKQDSDVEDINQLLFSAIVQGS